ncbi:MocR-like pyridoxine biosynthesis transcription factor PdxR [Andreprevotia chitinilytica]|uniref:MocR-like pyridoxine biosynthesis transcription factor PdxR n=1 Tax=Andreprevotia chitinilytica TaxID=396808 RepID=UPI0005524A5B|nr:PLP-dependent aminotransferase family protein [Andreprevotia chitinilytica]
MLRPWELALSIQRDGELPIHLQIAQSIIDEIQRGRLPPGTPLPGTRELAERLAVNRKTAVLAYDELIAQGWLRTQGRRGTFVAPELLANVGAASPHARDETPLVEASYRLYGAPWQQEAPSQPGTIEFSDGVPDSRLIPFDVLGRAYRRALIATARANRLAYGDPRGERPLREALAAMLGMERGLSADADNICVVRGSQMGIYLAARLLVRPGDHVALDALTYPRARETFRAAGAHTLSIAQDEWGMLPDDLERQCRQQRIQAVYLTPHHQFPTTVMMPVERRMRLLALAEQYGFAIVEDDYDHEFHFSHRPMFPLASVDRGGKVLYVGSLSKVLAPGLRVGYIVGSKDLIDRCAAEILLIDRQGNAVTELAVAELMHSGELKRHIRRALRVYEARRQHFAELIESALSPFASFNMPEGGLAFWLKLDPRLDIARLERDARAEGVRIKSSSRFADDGLAVHGLRLGFGNLTPEELTTGIERLRRALLKQSPL